jgi:hypothetical protein
MGNKGGTAGMNPVPLEGTGFLLTGVIYFKWVIRIKKGFSRQFLLG